MNITVNCHTRPDTEITRHYLGQSAWIEIGAVGIFVTPDIARHIAAELLALADEIDRAARGVSTPGEGA